MLHLFGYDHEHSEEAEAEMEEEEERLLKNLGWKGKGLIQSALSAESNETPSTKISDVILLLFRIYVCLLKIVIHRFNT